MIFNWALLVAMICKPECNFHALNGHGTNWEHLVFLSGGNFGKQMSKYIYIGVILIKLKNFKEQLSFWPPYRHTPDNIYKKF